jgi:protein-S-isoprenylcysteine O-methyltransferase Ste14
LADPGVYNNRVHVRKDKTNVRRVAYLTILLFASPSGWPLFTAGIILVGAGIMLHGWAAGYLARAGYAEREKILTIRGPYRHNRNPYYLAQMTMDLGFFFLAGQPWFYLFYFPIIFFVYRRWVLNEESFLESQFGQRYLIFMREVPRWGVRIKPAPARGSELRFQWATFMINRELPRSLSHIFFLLGFVFLFWFGNPFSQVSVLFRITLIAAITVWLALRDIHSLDVSQKSIGWFILATGSAALTAIFLISGPVWQPWSGTGGWIAIGAGLCFSLMVWIAILPGVAGASSKNGKSFFTRPICQWYVLTLALGLLSCTLGGIWLGIMLPFTIWALHLAGGMSIPMPPRRLSIRFGLLALIVCSGSLAVARQLN